MSVDELPSGSYRVRVTSGKLPNGKPRVVSRTLPPASTPDDLRRAELQLRIEAGSTSAEGDLAPLQDLVKAWIDSGEQRKAPSTVYKYRVIHGRWIAGHRLGRIPVSKVRTIDLEQHFAQILSMDADVPDGMVGPATVKQLHGILSGSFKWAVQMGWISSNPAAACTPIPDPQSKIVAATPDDFQRTVAVADEIQPGLAAYVLFLGLTGCRRSEALALTWADVGDDTVTIRESVSVVPGNGPVRKSTKTNRVRSMRVGEQLIAALADHQRRLLENCETVGIDFDPTMLVWSSDGLGQEPWRPDTAGKWVTKAAATAGVYVTPLMLRHMMPTLLLAAGEDIATVSRRMGHSRISTTLDVYAEAIPARDGAAADLLDRLIVGD